MEKKDLLQYPYLFCLNCLAVPKHINFTIFWSYQYSSYEDDDLTIEELGKLIAVEAEVHQDIRGRESRRRTGSLEDDAPPSLAPLQQNTLSLKVSGVDLLERKQQTCVSFRVTTITLWGSTLLSVG